MKKCIECRLRPIMGTSCPKSHFQKSLDLSPLRFTRFFGVAYGVIDRPQAALYSLYSNPRDARSVAHSLREQGYLAELVVYQVPEYLIK